MSRGQLTLIALAIGLSLVTWLSRPQPAAPASAPLTSTARDSIDHIHLRLGGRKADSLSLQRDDDGWRLTQPLELPADALAVDEILRLLDSKGRRELAAESLDLSKLSLQPPLWQVDIGQHRFELGGTEALSGDRYVRFGDKVYLVADLNAARFDNNYADLVTRALLPEADEIAEIRLPDAANGVRSITLLQSTAGLLFDRWQQARAQWLLRPSELDFAEVHSRVVIVTKSGQSIDFLIRSREPRLELIRPDLDLMYVLPASANDELIPGA